MFLAFTSHVMMEALDFLDIPLAPTHLSTKARIIIVKHRDIRNDSESVLFCLLHQQTRDESGFMAVEIPALFDSFKKPTIIVNYSPTSAC
jgi:hypothetical protein